MLYLLVGNIETFLHSFYMFFLNLIVLLKFRYNTGNLIERKIGNLGTCINFSKSFSF